MTAEMFFPMSQTHIAQGVVTSNTVVTSSIFAIFLSALAGTLLPLLYKGISVRLARIGNAFASGYLTSAALVHLLPSAHDSMHAALPNASFPYDGAASLAGAIIVYLVDICMRSRMHRKHRSGDDTHAHPSYSSISQLPQSSSDALLLPPRERRKAEPISEEENISFSNVPRHRTSIASALAATLSIHSIMEGVALGASVRHGRDFTILVTAILCHKLFAALTLGLALAAMTREMTESNETRRAMQIAIITALVFSSLTPLGAVLATTLTNVSAGVKSPVALAITQCACAGVFLYVACVDLLADEVRLCSCDSRDVLLRALVFTGAAFAMTLLAVWV